MKRMSGVLGLVLLFSLSAAPLLATEVFVAPTGVVQHDAERSYNGYVLYTPLSAGAQFEGRTTTFLIDKQGNVINSVPYPEGYSPGLYAFMIPNGNILRGMRPQAPRVPNPGGIWGGGQGGRVEEVTWDGDVVWGMDLFDADESDGMDYVQHHDFQKIFNKTLNKWTYLVLMWVRNSPEDAVALGANPDLPVAPQGLEDDWSPCALWEIDPETDDIIWRWKFIDHVVQNYDASKTAAFTDVTGQTVPGPTFGDPADYPGKIDINMRTYGGKHYGPWIDWNHCNSFSYDPDSGHIAINSKHMDEFYVLDHDGTFVSATDYDANYAASASDAGDFLYRFGQPYNYGQGEGPGWMSQGHMMMSASHDIQFMDPTRFYTGLPPVPGSRNFLIFDNGTWWPTGSRSSIIEINPFIQGAGGSMAGTYVNPPDAGYSGNENNQVVWRYTSSTEWNFYSHYISGAQRLPNGNTSICSGGFGHLFEVTPDKEVVWEFINPIGNDGQTTIVTEDSQYRSHAVFRSYQYDPAHPGLAGMDLTPKGDIRYYSTGADFSGIKNEFDAFKAAQ